jgi:hypothetical protein
MFKNLLELLEGYVLLAAIEIGVVSCRPLVNPPSENGTVVLTVAYAGGASIGRAIVRVTFWSALTMGLTAGVGALLGVAA